MVDDIGTVFRDFNNINDPASGEYEPEKPRIRKLLRDMRDGSGQSVTRGTLAALNAVTPPTENYMGIVLDDPDTANDGFYSRVSSAWVWERGFPDTAAAITLGGTANAQTGTSNGGINPADVVFFFAEVATENTGAMTLSIDGETPRDVVNTAGNALSAGEWTGAILFYLDGNGDYRLLLDPGSVSASAANATAAQTARDEAEAFAALSGPTGVYSGVHTGDGSTVTFALPVEPTSAAHVWVAVDGILQDPDAYTVDGTDLTFVEAPPETLDDTLTPIANISYRIVSIATGEDVPPDGSVTTSKLGNLAVETAKLADLAVTKAKVADDSIDADKLDGSDVADIRTLLDVYSKAEVDAKFTDDEIALVTAAGYGSTATRIVRFTTIERDTTGGMTLTQSATNGDSITIASDGIYAMTVEIESTDASREFGISRNQSSLTTGITSIAVAQQVCSAEGTASRRSNAARTMRLAAGDVIRVCTDGGTLNTGAGDCRFSIVRIS